MRPGVICCEETTPSPKLPHIRFFEGRSLRCRIPVPIGAGYATSAAISISYALSQYDSFLEAISKAHTLEVMLKTGLGDVMAIAFGRGLTLRVSPGGPGWGRIKSINVPTNVRVLTFETKGQWSDTPSMLSSITNYSIFDDLWTDFIAQPSLEKFLNVAYEFTKFIGFNTRVIEDVLKIEGVIGGYVKKSVALLVVENDKVEDVKDILLRTKSSEVREFTITTWGPRAFEEP